MSIQVINNFPSVPLGPVVSSDGYLTPPWQQYFTQVTMFMNTNVNSEGVKLPQQPNSLLTGGGALNNSNSIGNLVYNSTNNTSMVNLNGTFKTIQTV